MMSTIFDFFGISKGHLNELLIVFQIWTQRLTEGPAGPGGPIGPGGPGKPCGP